MLDTTNRTTIRELMVYNDWAMEKILGAAGALSPSALDAQPDPVPTTLRHVLHHLAEAETLWFRRWREEPNPALTEPDPSLSPEDMAARWRDTSASRNAFLDSQGAEGERRQIQYRNLAGDAFQYPLGDLMLHLANHGAHHRAQAATLLRRAGGDPPPLDYLSMRRELPTSKEGAEEDRAPVSPPTFDPETILEYYRYADWAGRRFHDAAARLTEADLDREFPIGLGSLRKTLLHIHDAEAWWLGAWRDRNPAELRDLPPGTSIPDLIRHYAKTAESRNAFLASAGPPDLLRVLPITTTDGGTIYWRVGESALQLCLHGTHHRAQMVWKLRALGVDPPGLDYITWLGAGSP